MTELPTLDIDALNPLPCIHPTRQTSLGAQQAQEGPMTVFVYINTAKQLGDVDYVKVIGGS
jgi:hypothetical protein